MNTDTRPFDGARNDDIEILRGVAIVLVLMDHIFAFCNTPFIISLTNDFFSFWGGVDLFFAISGYVIASTLLRQKPTQLSHQERVARLVSFWIRRVWRLWPAAWFWLFVPYGLGLLIIPQFQSWQAHRELLASVVGALLSVVNIQQWHFEAGFGMPNPLWSQYWSLSLEQQFYLITAPLLLFLRQRYAVVVLVLLIAGQFFLVRPANSSDLLWFVRSDAFAWGVLIAILFTKPNYRELLEPTVLRHIWAAWLVLSLAILTLISTQLLYSVPCQVGMMALASALLVFVASYDKEYLGIYGLTARLLSWTGDRSYAIYLVHASVIVFVLNVGPLARLNRDNGVNDLLITAVVLALTFILSELSYRLIEVPARLHGRTLARKYTENISSM